ncbi:MAG: mechanosensitive ion channel domain-containing protein [Parcubacteria group bacterium]
MVGDIIRQSFERYGATLVGKLPALLAALIVVAFCIILAGFVRLVAKRVRGRRALLIARLLQVAIGITAGIVALGILGVNVTGMIAALGLVSVGFSFALQDLLVNFLAGLQLLGQAPFERGDTIIVSDVRGTVRFIGSRAVKLEGPAGEIIYVPNRDLLLKPVKVLKKHAGSRRYP